METERVGAWGVDKAVEIERAGESGLPGRPDGQAVEFPPGPADELLILLIYPFHDVEASAEVADAEVKPFLVAALAQKILVRIGFVRPEAVVRVGAAPFVRGEVVCRLIVDAMGRPVAGAHSRLGGEIAEASLMPRGVRVYFHAVVCKGGLYFLPCHELGAVVLREGQGEGLCSRPECWCGLNGSHRPGNDKICHREEDTPHPALLKFRDRVYPVAHMAVVKGKDDGFSRNLSLPHTDRQKLLAGNGLEPHAKDSIQMGLKSFQGHASGSGDVVKAEDGDVAKYEKHGFKGIKTVLCYRV